MKKLFLDLQKLKKKSFGAYKSLKGRYAIGNIGMQLYHVQGDPFAPPSKLSLRIPIQESGYPEFYYSSKRTQIAFCDFLHRILYHQVDFYSENVGSGKSGMITVSKPCQQILQRSVVQIQDEFLEVRIDVGLPAQGRDIDVDAAVKILTDFIPSIATSVLLAQNVDSIKLEQHITCYINQCGLRDQLSENNFLAFIADGAMLPRAAGNSDEPLLSGVPFISPHTCAVTLMWGGVPITGMAIKTGCTLIVGGGYHGKSTLLKSLESGIYNHILGDGRERVVSVMDMVKIRAEEGRSITNTDISYFINNIPGKSSTRLFSTTNASGSTSQAANIAEALELGVTTLLIDEDISAANFLVRDKKMQLLIPGDKEPITPLLHRVKSLKAQGINVIIVAGASGDFMDCADTVIAMDTYIPKDVTLEAQSIARTYPADIPQEIKRYGSTQRYPELAHLNSTFAEFDKGRFSTKIRVKGLDTATIGAVEIDMRFVDHLVCSEQLRTIAGALYWGSNNFKEGHYTVRQLCEQIIKTLEEHSLDYISSAKSGDLAEVRLVDIGIALNRIRNIKISAQ